MIGGLQEVSKDLLELNINFHLLKGKHDEEIPKFIKDLNVGCLVCDFSPLRVHREWVEKIKNKLPANIPFIRIDAHNIVPVWTASDKQEQAAYLFRAKINDKLDEFLTEFPPVIRQPYNTEKSPPVDWKSVLDHVKADPASDEVDIIKPGYRNSCDMLNSFLHYRLHIYATKRNDPTVDAQSNLSPYFHFGQLSPHRAVLEVSKHRAKASKSVESFDNEAIVWREMSENFCFYNKNYDNWNGVPDWAKQSLNDHRKDKREYLYTCEEFENAKTHDILWNCAQIQMKREGKMHGFFRMYWAKKILEWTKSPEEALEIAIYLNDRYNIDGRDPNGYAGIMWSIGGVHDRPFMERPVIGKIRGMTYNGCKQKFDINKFIARYRDVAYAKK
jgi:deoxyribodipyrimidine photo-lyase